MLTSGRITTTSCLSEWVHEARRRTIDLVEDLDDEQLCVPLLESVNPLIWELGHVAWFQEKWILRHVKGDPPVRQDADRLFDSIAVLHDDRWHIDLPSRQSTFEYVCEVEDRVAKLLDHRPISDELAYFIKLTVFHEDMHAEAFTYMRQALGYPAPRFMEACGNQGAAELPLREPAGSLEIPGGAMMLGARRDGNFVFDNEQWEHAVDVAPFTIAAETVTQEDFAVFVDSGGYHCREFWCDSGWSWREQAEASHPVYWRKDDSGRWLRRDFDRFVPLESRKAVIHVNLYEAEAWCRWAGRRLPTEAEWELAAAYTPDTVNNSTGQKRPLPWGDDPPDADRANLDWNNPSPIDVTALPLGDSAFGCRQMLGNVWEWTSSRFVPYPGFTPGPYEEYSQPWFYSRNVLRGGCWSTRSRLLRNTLRNYFMPHRRDIFAGFRTCGT